MTNLILSIVGMAIAMVVLAFAGFGMVMLYFFWRNQP
jgi:hypothetical protein